MMGDCGQRMRRRDRALQRSGGLWPVDRSLTLRRAALLASVDACTHRPAALRRLPAEAAEAVADILALEGRWARSWRPAVRAHLRPGQT